MEAQSPVAKVDDDWNENADPAAARGAQQRVGIGFAIERKIGGNAGAGLESRQPGDCGCGTFGALRVLRQTKGAPFGAQLFT
jgi:hypothetical protein